MSRAADGGLATPSLRRRVTLVVLALVAVMVLALGVVTDRVLADRLDSQLRDRLVDRAGVASALVDQVDGRDLARRLEGEGVSAVVTSPDGSTYAEGALAGGATALQGQPAEPAQTPGVGPGGPGPAGGDGPPTPPGDPAGVEQVEQSGDILSIDRELDDGTRVRLLADAGDVATTMAQVRLALLVAGLLVLVLAALAVPPVVRRTLRPLDQITEVARSISDGDRELRLRPSDPDTELGRTASAFDLVLDEVTGAERRATASEARLRAFLSDAAHELRTPLTGVQAAAERILRDDPDRAERERVLVMLLRESRRAGRLVEDMLLMGRLDAGLDLGHDPVDLAAVARDAVATRAVLHPGASLGVEVLGAAGGVEPEAEVVVAGDRDRLVQVVGNLLDNAVNAGGPGTAVRVELSRRAGEVLLRVCDDGPGVPAAERERIFERLVRLEAARSTRSGGVGLGLPIARGLARAHGGELRCVDPATVGRSGGAVLELSLPAAADPADRWAQAAPKRIEKSSTATDAT